MPRKSRSACGESAGSVDGLFLFSEPPVSAADVEETGMVRRRSRMPVASRSVRPATTGRSRTRGVRDPHGEAHPDTGERESDHGSRGVGITLGPPGTAGRDRPSPCPSPHRFCRAGERPPPSHPSLGLDDAPVLQKLNHPLNALLQRQHPGVDDELGVLGLLIGRGDAGELLDLAGARLFVQPFDVALLADLQGCLAVDLQEASGHDEFANPLTVSAERGDEGGHDDHTRLDEQLGYLADAADVLSAILIRETEVAAETVADVVAVENEGPAAPLVEPLLHRVGQRRLARAGKAGEPHDDALVAVQLLAHLAVDAGVVPDDMGAFLAGHQ